MVLANFNFTYYRHPPILIYLLFSMRKIWSKPQSQCNKTIIRFSFIYPQTIRKPRITLTIPNEEEEEPPSPPSSQTTFATPPPLLPEFHYLVSPLPLLPEFHQWTIERHNIISRRNGLTHNWEHVKHHFGAPTAALKFLCDYNIRARESLHGNYPLLASSQTKFGQYQLLHHHLRQSF